MKKLITQLRLALQILAREFRTNHLIKSSIDFIVWMFQELEEQVVSGWVCQLLNLL